MKLDGVKVLDLGWVWAGPLVSAAFADLGADVVKVESSARLDPYRLRGVERDPRYTDVNRHEASPSFHKLNRGKRSIRVNLRHPAGRDLVLRLAEQADLLIENFSGGTLARLGLDWPVLRERNPALVALSMSAGGQTGRWRDMRAYALITTAMAGYESLIAYPGEDPVGGATFGIADPTISSFGVFGAMAAVWSARRTGQGAYLDLSGVESVISVLGAAFLPPDDAETAPTQHCLPCAEADSWVAVGLVDDRERAALAKLAGLDGGPTADDLLWTEVADWSATLPRAEVLARLWGERITAVPVYSIEERNADPALASHPMSIAHPVTGPEDILPSPWGTADVPRPAPLLGQHTEVVLREWLGLSDTDIAELVARDVLI